MSMKNVITKKGAVSAEVAIQMAQGALQNAGADIAISITGIAGPGNDSTTKKVGTVYVGIASNTWANAESTQIGGNRSENKIGFVHFALLTAIRLWDTAMEKAEANRQKLQQLAIEKKRLDNNSKSREHKEKLRPKNQHHGKMSPG